MRRAHRRNELIRLAPEDEPSLFGPISFSDTEPTSESAREK